MFTKEQIDSEIAILEDKLKTATPMEYDKIEASRRVWLGRRAAWASGMYNQPAAEEVPQSEDADSESEPKIHSRRKTKKLE